MADLFPGRPDVLANTRRVADLCEFDFEKKYFLPEFPRPPQYLTDNELLVELATSGAERRYGSPLPAHVASRLEYELDVITHTGYAGYFLIVQDFIQAARDRGIPVGPGRGSAAGSLVAYGLGITNVDPLKFDLLFERFLNPERVSMPDIDVDFCFERRGEVIEYVSERYGRESVGQIITFGTLKARAAVRDIARVLRVPLGEADRLAKLIPSGPAYAAVGRRSCQEGARAGRSLGARTSRRPAAGSRPAHRRPVAPRVGARRRHRDRPGTAVGVRAGLRGASAAPGTPARRTKPSSPSTTWSVSSRSACSRSTSWD